MQGRENMDLAAEPFLGAEYIGTNPILPPPPTPALGPAQNSVGQKERKRANEGTTERKKLLVPIVLSKEDSENGKGREEGQSHGRGRAEVGPKEGGRGRPLRLRSSARVRDGYEKGFGRKADW